MLRPTNNQAPATAPVAPSSIGHLLSRGADLTALTNLSGFTVEYRYPEGYEPLQVLSPLEAAMLFTAAKHRDNHRRRGAYACYVRGRQVVGLQRLANISGDHHKVNLIPVIEQAYRCGANGVILATWQLPDDVAPLYEAQEEEVSRQFKALSAASIRLLDSMRLSDTGMFSAFTAAAEPFNDRLLEYTPKGSLNSLY